MVDIGFSFPPDMGPRSLLRGLSQTRVLSLLVFTGQASGFTKAAEDPLISQIYILARKDKGRRDLQRFSHSLEDDRTCDGWVYPFLGQCTATYRNDGGRKELHLRYERAHPL